MDILKWYVGDNSSNHSDPIWLNKKGHWRIGKKFHTSVETNIRIIRIVYSFGPFSISEYYSNIYIVQMH